MEENVNGKEKFSGSSKQTKAATERELRKRAMKLDLGPMLGKVFRYVTVNKDGECEEVDEQFVRERRESLMQGSSTGISLKKTPLRKIRKARKASTFDSRNAEIDAVESCNKPQWLPDSFTVTRTTQTHISGWVKSEEELSQVLSCHANAFSCRFVSWYRGRGISNSIDSKRISWKREDIEPGCPFAIDSYLVRHCPYGMRLKRLAEVRDSFRESEKVEEKTQASIACHARLKIRRVTLYDGFTLNPRDKTKQVMWEKMMCVKQLISQGQEMSTSSRIYSQLPLPDAHNNHTVLQPYEAVKAEIDCTDGIKEAEVILNEHQEDISYDPSKLEAKEINDTSIGDAFVLPDMTVGNTEAATNDWKVEQSFMHDTANNVLESDAQQNMDCSIKRARKNEEFKFEVRPPQKRTHILTSCKVDCPARIKVKRVSLYESFKLEEGDSRRKRDDKMLMVKDMINNGAHDLQATAAIFMQLPLAAAHRNHQVSVPVGHHEQEVSTVTTFEVDHILTSQQQHHPNMTWLPQCFTVTACGLEYVTGWVHTEEEYLHVLEKHRHAFGCSFLAWSNDKERTFKAEADRRVMWKKDFIDPGCPLTVHHSLILACAYSDQNKGKPHASPVEELQSPGLPCLAPEMGQSIIQVPPELVPDGTSLEIQYCDAAHQYPELQSNETYIILVENS